MTTTAYDMPRMYDWPVRRRRRPIVLRVAKVVVTLAALVLPVGFVAMLAGGLSANVMVTGSMEPKIGVGAFLLYESVPPETLRLGDVISFQRPGDQTVTTHRIVAVGRRGATPAFRTRGDNNPVVDPWVIHYERGQEPKRLVAAVPYVGHVMRTAETPAVRIAVIVLLLGWLFVSFLRALARRTGRRGDEACTAPLSEAAARPVRSGSRDAGTDGVPLPGLDREAVPSAARSVLSRAGSRSRRVAPRAVRRPPAPVARS